MSPQLYCYIIFHEVQPKHWGRMCDPLLFEAHGAGPEVFVKLCNIVDYAHLMCAECAVTPRMDESVAHHVINDLYLRLQDI